jgi:hypothetical protein
MRKTFVKLFSLLLRTCRADTIEVLSQKLITGIYCVSESEEELFRGKEDAKKKLD